MPMISFSAQPALTDAAFDTEATQLLGSAFEAAWQAVKTSRGGLLDEAQAASIRERLAKRIIEMGRRGQRNHDQLVEEALRHLAETKAANDAAALSHPELTVSLTQHP
jgi:hypothetical protein